MRALILTLCLVLLAAAPLQAQGDIAPIDRVEPALATAMATYWLVAVMQVEPPILILAIERHEPLAGDYPQDRALWVVSALVIMGSPGDEMQPVTACWGVVVDPVGGSFYGAAGGEIPWLRC